MYRQNRMQETSIEVNESIEGETIEQKIERVVNNKEPISDGAPLIYTERKDGVGAGYNIRTDRFEVAVDAMDAVSKSHTAKRQGKIEEREKIVKDFNENQRAEKDKNIDGKSESTQDASN